MKEFGKQLKPCPFCGESGLEINPNIKAALNASVSAIYFADSSDYKSYHYEVIRNLTKLDEPSEKDIKKLFKKLNPK